MARTHARRLLLAALLTVALSGLGVGSAQALGIRVTQVSVVIDSAESPASAREEATSSVVTTYELDCASATECTIVGFQLPTITGLAFGVTRVADPVNIELEYDGSALNMVQNPPIAPTGIFDYTPLMPGGIPFGQAFTYDLLNVTSDPFANVNGDAYLDLAGCPDGGVADGFDDLRAGDVPGASGFAGGFAVGQSGQLGGVGCFASSAPVSFTITAEIVATPEPGTGLLLTGGLLGLAWIGRRRA